MKWLRGQKLIVLTDVCAGSSIGHCSRTLRVQVISLWSAVCVSQTLDHLLSGAEEWINGVYFHSSATCSTWNLPRTDNNIVAFVCLHREPNVSQFFGAQQSGNVTLRMKIVKGRNLLNHQTWLLFPLPSFSDFSWERFNKSNNSISATELNHSGCRIGSEWIFFKWLERSLYVYTGCLFELEIITTWARYLSCSGKALRRTTVAWLL